MEQENLNKGTPPPETATVLEVQPPAQEVKPEAKQEPPKSAPPKKELTPAEMQKRKKLLIMPLFFLIFGAAMWLIFAPSGKEKEKEDRQSGLNVELPMPKDAGLVSDKRDAYERDAMQQKEKERMRSLQDFSVQLADAEEQNEERRVNATSPEYYEAPSRSTGASSSLRTSSTGAIQSSTAAYQDINKQLGEWYEKPATEPDEKAKSELDSRIQELERKLDENAQRKQAADDQLELMEKSYQLAAKYMPQTPGQTTDESDKAAPKGQSDKVIAQPVKQVRQNVVPYWLRL